MADQSQDHLMRRVAEELHRALSAGDVDAAARLYRDDLVVWHNHDRIDRIKAESLAGISALAEEYADFAVVDVRIDVLDDGYVERCVFVGTHRRSATPLSVEAMLRVWSDGRTISRIEEYTDSAQGVVPGQS
jgi:ketosteroid isomerase-like protein